MFTPTEGGFDQFVNHEFFLWEDIDWDNIQVLEMEEDSFSFRPFIPDFDILQENTFGEQEEERLALGLVPAVLILSAGTAALACYATKHLLPPDSRYPADGYGASGVFGASVGYLGTSLAAGPLAGKAFFDAVATAPYAWPILVPTLFSVAGGVLCYEVPEDGETPERLPSQP